MSTNDKSKEELILDAVHRSRNRTLKENEYEMTTLPLPYIPNISVRAIIHNNETFYCCRDIKSNTGTIDPENFKYRMRNYKISSIDRRYCYIDGHIYSFISHAALIYMFVSGELANVLSGNKTLSDNICREIIYGYFNKKE